MTVMAIAIFYDSPVLGTYPRQRAVNIIKPRGAYRVRERVRFLHYPPEMLELRRALPQEIKLPQDAELEEYLLDRNGLRFYQRQSAFYKHPLLHVKSEVQAILEERKAVSETDLRALIAAAELAQEAQKKNGRAAQKALEREARKAVRHMIYTICRQLTGEGLPYPMHVILSDPTITTSARAACITHLLRSEFLIHPDRKLNGNYQDCLRKANAFIEKYYILSRYFPEIFEEEKLPLPYDFSEGTEELFYYSIYGKWEELCQNHKIEPLVFWLDNGNYIPTVSPRFPCTYHYRLVNRLFRLLKNVVFYETRDFLPFPRVQYPL